MPRQPRFEIEGGLYHVITRGNDRRDIFHSEQDFQKFLSLLKLQKDRLPFFLYAFCLMTNHVHFLIERKTDAVGRIMHRVLTGYSQYYNRRYKKVGHLLQGRYKSIYCQSEGYMGELVRYIHLNPVRAKMVPRAEDYPYSSHRAYLGLAPAGIVDVDPVLRLFGAKKEQARENFAQYVAAGRNMGYRPDLYSPPKGILGSEDFVDAAIHRLGDTGHVPHYTDGRLGRTPDSFRAEDLLRAIELACGVLREDLCGPAKGKHFVQAKEVLILAGRHAGASVKTLSELSGLNASTISRRNDAARLKLRESEAMQTLLQQAIGTYQKSIK